MARWTASAKWAAGPALDGWRDMPLALRLSEGLGLTRHLSNYWFEHDLETTAALFANFLCQEAE